MSNCVYAESVRTGEIGFAIERFQKHAHDFAERIFAEIVQTADRAARLIRQRALGLDFWYASVTLTFPRSRRVATIISDVPRALHEIHG